MPPIALLTRAIAPAAGVLFAAFIAAKGIPTLRHDWTWPIDRAAIPSFLDSAVQGWLSSGLGTSNPHPTGYLLAFPLGLAMWLFGPLAALAMLAAVTGYLCMSTVAAAASHWRTSRTAAAGLGLFALFNPWVYNEVVAGHLVMVLAYGGLIGMVAEMLRGRNASPIRLALWIVLVEAQLQFFLLGMLALVVFALSTRIWLPVLAGVLAGLPSAVGLAAERATLLRIPYGLEWQTNQSIQPAAFVGLGGYFAGYSDALGIAGAAAAWLVLVLAIAGAILARRTKAAKLAIAGAALISAIVLGVHGPLAGPYAWAVRNVPESGVFRELYDLAGVTAALVVVLACAATARIRALSYVALAAGAVLPVMWMLHPPNAFWIGSRAYPHPVVAAPPYARVALVPAFQPLALRSGGGDGADPDVFVYPQNVPALNEYFPAYPVDMALARYEQTGSVDALRSLGVATIVSRPWLISRTRGGIGLAAASLQPRAAHGRGSGTYDVADAAPLISECGDAQIVLFADSLGACDVFFGDVPGAAPVRPVAVPGDSIDPQIAWIDARLAFAEVPELAQGIGGALTLSPAPMPVEPASWLLAYLRGRLIGPDGRSLARRNAGFVWIRVPPGVASVACDGLCELVAQTLRRPPTAAPLQTTTRALEFHQLAPWLYVVEREAASSGDALLRFNERYDAGWIAVSAGRALPHLRIDSAVNGWMLGASAGSIVLVQVTSVAQLMAEIVGAGCVLWLLKALYRAPEKRVKP